MSGWRGDVQAPALPDVRKAAGDEVVQAQQQRVGLAQLAGRTARGRAATTHPRGRRPPPPGPSTWARRAPRCDRARCPAASRTRVRTPSASGELSTSLRGYPVSSTSSPRSRRRSRKTSVLNGFGEIRWSHLATSRAIVRRASAFTPLSASNAIRFSGVPCQVWSHTWPRRLGWVPIHPFTTTRPALPRALTWSHVPPGYAVVAGRAGRRCPTAPVRHTCRSGAPERSSSSAMARGLSE